MGRLEGCDEGWFVGDPDGCELGPEGLMVGCDEGFFEGLDDGWDEGPPEGCEVG